MSHAMTAAVQTAINAGHSTFMVLVELDFQSGFVRVCNANISITWNGFTWSGLGELGQISAISESADLEAAGLTMQLSGIPLTIISTALNEQYQGRSVKVWIAPLDPDTQQTITDPILIFNGRGDTMSIDLGTTATLTYSAESRLADWDRARVRRFNSPDQKLDYLARGGGLKVGRSPDILCVPRAVK